METLGIDIGGSGIKGAVVDCTKGEMISPRFRLATPEKAKPDAVAEVVGNIVHHFEWQGPVGCGFPAVVRGGMVYTASNIHSSWIGTHASALFSRASGCPFYMINDADAAGMAELKFGIGKERKKGVIIFLTIGTGIGSAIFIDGTLVPNTEFGHLQIRGKDAEWRASDATRQAKELSWNKWAKRLEEYLTSMENLFWPDLFILGGGVSRYSEKFLPLISIKTEIVPAKLLNQAGIIGAAVNASIQI